MVRSMTGYGRFEGVIDGRKITFEIKSVNHRFFELSVRTTKGYSFIEDKIKELVSKYASRGKIDVFVSVEADENTATDVKINHSLAAGYVNAMRELCNTYQLKDDISVSTLLKYSDIFTIHKAPENEEQIASIVEKAAISALESFVCMRECEGEKMKIDVLEHSKQIISIVSEIEELSPQITKEYYNRLYERLSEVLNDTTVDPQRIITEAAIFADKTSVAEETVRLRSHFAQMEEMLSKSEPIGRKLDFIVQEMNREANTIGSKVNNADLAHKVVDIKSEIEKIREQIQNIE